MITEGDIASDAEGNITGGHEVTLRKQRNQTIKEIFARKTSTNNIKAAQVARKNEEHFRVLRSKHVKKTMHLYRVGERRLDKTDSIDHTTATPSPAAPTQTEHIARPGTYPQSIT